MQTTLRTSCITGALLLTVSAATAQSLGGGAFIPVQDGSSHECIDVTQSTVSMSLITAQLKRTDTFWKTSKTLGVKIDVKLLNQSSQPFDFPRGRQLSVASYTGAIGLLPMVFPVMAKYSLLDPNDTKPYVNVGLDVFLINLEGQTGLTKGVLSFIEFSKNLPLPANPYSQGVQLFGEFAQKIVDSDIQTTEDKLPAATLSFDLASSSDDVSRCEKQASDSWHYPILREGIVAVMWDYEGKPEDGFVRVGDVDKYCYYPTVSQRISFAAKANGACPASSQAKPLNNPLVAFAINKWALKPSTVKISSLNLRPIADTGTKPAFTFSAVEAIANHASSKLEGLSANKVKIYFDAINKDKLGEVLNSEPQEAVKSVREVETAIALYRCGLMGISANQCL